MGQRRAAAERDGACRSRRYAAPDGCFSWPRWGRAATSKPANRRSLQPPPRTPPRPTTATRPTAASQKGNGILGIDNHERTRDWGLGIRNRLRFYNKRFQDQFFSTPRTRRPGCSSLSRIIFRNNSSSVVVGLPMFKTCPLYRSIACLTSSWATRAEAGGADFGHVADLQEAIDAAHLLQLALVQDGDAVANVLHVGQQVAAHQDGLAFVAELEDQVFHLAACGWGPDRSSARRG